MELDMAYIPSRDPNAHPVGFPGSTYNKVMAEPLIEYAKEIVGYCKVRVDRDARVTG
jgi:HEPN domain-containing protein